MGKFWWERERERGTEKQLSWKPNFPEKMINPKRVHRWEEEEEEEAIKKHIFWWWGKAKSPAFTHIIIKDKVFGKRKLLQSDSTTNGNKHWKSNGNTAEQYFILYNK